MKKTILIIGSLLLLFTVALFCDVASLQKAEPIVIRGGRGGQTIGANGEDGDSYKIVDGKIVIDKKGGGGKGGKGSKITGDINALSGFLKQLTGGSGTAGQGNNGGTGVSSAPNYGQGGGGGAGAVGETGQVEEEEACF